MFILLRYIIINASLTSCLTTKTRMSRIVLTYLVLFLDHNFFVTQSGGFSNLKKILASLFNKTGKFYA